MKWNKTEILLVLLILSIIFHGIITRPIESKYEFYYLNENVMGIYDKENEKFYTKNHHTEKFNEIHFDEDNLVE